MRSPTCVVWRASLLSAPHRWLKDTFLMLLKATAWDCECKENSLKAKWQFWQHSGFPRICAKCGFFAYPVTELSKAQSSRGWRVSDFIMFAKQRCTSHPPGSVLRAWGACGQQLGLWQDVLVANLKVPLEMGRQPWVVSVVSVKGVPDQQESEYVCPLVRGDIPL